MTIPEIIKNKILHLDIKKFNKNHKSLYYYFNIGENNLLDYEKIV